MPAAIVIEHLLFLFLLVVAPLWDYRYTSRLKREPNSPRKIGVYQTLCGWLWTATIVAWLAVGWRTLFTIDAGAGQISWIHISPVRYAIGTVLALLAGAVLLPILIVSWKQLTRQPRKYNSAGALQALAWFLPATWRERRWYALLSVTAGICEEFLFRGFVLQYLHVSPWKVNLTVALVISAVIFGFQHLYLGLTGAAQTMVLGFLLGLLYLVSGNLLLPILLHAVADLRMLMILRPPAEQSRSAGA
jgi:membrane protease YdiL (CAAX protease family)